MTRRQPKNSKFGNFLVPENNNQHNFATLNSMKNSSTVDLLFQNFSSKHIKEKQNYANLGIPIQKTSTDSKKNLFKLAESLINNEVSQSSTNSLQTNYKTLNNEKDNIDMINPNFKKKSNKENITEKLSQPITTSNQTSIEESSRFTSRLKETKIQISEKVIQLQAQIKNEAATNKTLIKDLQKFIEDLTNKQSAHHLKQKQTTSNMKQEYRKAFTKLVEQVNNKFISMDRNILNIRQQAQISETTSAKRYEQLNHKIQQMNIICLNLEQRMNNDLKIENFDQDDYLLSLKESKQEFQGIHYSVRQNEEILLLHQQIESLKNQLTCPQKTETILVSPNDLLSYEKIREQIQSVFKEKEFTSKQIFTKQYERILRIHEDNISRMNQEFQRVINQHINPRINKIQESLKKSSFSTTLNPEQSIKKIHDEVSKIKSDFQQKIKKNEILHIRKSQTVLNKIAQAKEYNNPKQTYLVDQENYLLDSTGNYLVDQNKQRIKVSENEIYLLEVQGIPIIDVI